jgi:hypothetical protein
LAATEWREEVPDKGVHFGGVTDVKRILIGAGLALTGLLMTGCSSSPSAQQSTTTSSSSASASTTMPGRGPGPATTSVSQTVNLPVTNQIRAQLIAAGAAVNNIPVSEYTGLAAGLTYYAFDPATNTYWAGARLVPGLSSDPSNPTRAQVASQDDGSYYLFSRPKGGGWTAVADGNVGPNTPCPVTVPSAVVKVWGWPAGSCRPSGT